MKIIRARSAGFCMGVSLALRTLEDELATHAPLARGSALENISTCCRAPGEAVPRIITLGPIIHNPRVMREYEERGVICQADPVCLQAGDHVIIRAHGVPIAVEEALRNTGVQVIDATCPKVKKAQLAIARQRKKQRATLLLFGEKEHPEVQGLVSYAEGEAYVFGSLEELKTLPLVAEAPYFLAAQTTQDSEEFAKVRELLAVRLSYVIPVLDTICNATRHRQEEVIALAREVDALVVVGGRNSGNTRRLADVAKAHGAHVVLVESAEELTPEMFAKAKIVGLTAGASTPEAHINAIQTFLENV